MYKQLKSKNVTPKSDFFFYFFGKVRIKVEPSFNFD
jgi:hypothetical protein